MYLGDIAPSMDNTENCLRIFISDACYSSNDCLGNGHQCITDTKGVKECDCAPGYKFEEYELSPGLNSSMCLGRLPCHVVT